MIGQKLAGRYEITSELGRGGMGVVYRAHDPLLGREVAVKVITPSLLTAEAEERFKAEAQVVAQMDHPSIVSIYDFGHHEGSLFFVMPILEGTSLHQMIREQSLVLATVLDVGIAVAEALAYSHSRSVIHRDIKPENIMILPGERNTSRVRVMDFGLARRTRVTALTKTGAIVGTVSYASPEQVSGGEIDGRSDLYSLGTVLYHCVTNQVPFTGELQSVLYRIVHEVPQAPRALGAEIDDELEAIILSCLEKDPAMRPRTADDLTQALVGYREQNRNSDRMNSTMISRTIQVPRPALTPFVDRIAEVKELQQRLNHALAGECQLCMLSGEPGVGKTRLLEELEGLARARDVRVLHGRFVEQDAAFPYHGFCELIQEYFRRKETSSSPSVQIDLSDLGSDLISLFPMLSEIDAIRRAASGSSQPSQIEPTRSPQDRTQIFELLARTLARMAGGRPLLLLLEDLHGAEVSIEAVQYIVRRLGPTPTMIVGTYRSTETGRRHPLVRMLDGFRGDRRFSSIELRPFSVSAHRQYVATLVAGSQVVDSLAHGLYEASEGNPFFTKELLRSLLDSGGITQNDAGAWTLSGERDISSDALPATIHQAVGTRIGRLPDDLREVLSIAAVMGKSFEYRDLEVLARDQGDLDEIVDRLIQEGLIEEERRSRKGDHLTFVSGVIREVLYGELSRRKRRLLHRKYAETLERRYGGRLDRVYPQLVHHFSGGDVPDKTVEYGLLHAKRALRAFGGDEVIRSAKTALEFLDEEWDGEPSIEGEARMVLAAGYRMTGDVDGALKEIESAIRIFERERETSAMASALLFASKVAWQARRTEQTRRWVERGVEVARSQESPTHLRQLLSLGAALASLRGEYARAGELRDEAERLRSEGRESASDDTFPEGGTLVVALANPVVADAPVDVQLVEEAEIYTNVFETLLTTDQEGNLTPALAETLEPLEGGSAFRITLRPDVRFQQGEPLTALRVKESFEFSLRRAAANLPPGLASIRGALEFARKETNDLAGVIVHSDLELEIRLKDALPIYPVLLSDPRTAIGRQPSREQEGSRLLGTGPFRLGSRDADKLVLERSTDYWKGDCAKIDAIEFRPGLSSASIASGLRSGALDLARDLLPQDLEEILRDPRYRGRLVETPQQTTYFILFNSRSGPVARNESVRRALAGVVRTRDLVWRTLGRFAQPASGFLPPGTLGHDPGRRPYLITPDEAREMLRGAGVSAPIRLVAVVHPLIHDRYASLWEALVSVWADLGVEVSVKTSDMGSYLEAWKNSEGIDLLATRWNSDYYDADGFTHTLFHSETGIFRSYYAVPEADEILEKARSEIRPSAREGLYRKFERMLLDSGAVIPLHQDVDYRIAGPKVRGIKLSSVPPHVNYSEVAKAEAAIASPRIRPQASGVVRIPMTGQVMGLDPVMSCSVETDEVLPSIYETLTRDVGEAQIVPWLAAEFHSEAGETRYRFRLRDNVFFHDGRRLTARDVRHSFERLLQNRQSQGRWRYAPIAGARAVLDGTRCDLSGFRIVSATEFTIDLEKPVSFFPGLMSVTPAAIVPEGTGSCGNDRRSGAVGTGPFRVARFDPGRRLELERNPSYWREGYPRARELVFHFGVSPQEILAGFRAGRYSVASDLYPEDVDVLRREATYAAGYHETPRLSTYYIAFNIHRGPLNDLGLRRKIVQSLDVRRLVQRTLRKVAIPAQGLIPPGLLGHEPSMRPAAAPEAPPLSSVDVELRAAVHPVFSREYASFFESLCKSLLEVGVKIRPTTESMSDLLESKRQTTVDLALVQWVADYPDADTFVHILQTREGFVGPLCGSPEIDRLIDAGRADRNPEARHATYRLLEEVIADEARLLPLFHEQVYRFARPELEGLNVSYRNPAVSYENLKFRAR